MSKLAQTTKHFYLWQTVVGAAFVGGLASFIQIIERIQFAETPTKELFCNLNSVFSCSNVFAAWQSSVFGFSNAIMCLAFFAIILGAGLAGLTDAQLSRNLRLSLQAVSVFFLLFGAWYLWQSTFVIGSLCIFCIFCYSAVILLNLAWLRLNAEDFPHAATHTLLSRIISKQLDLAFWAAWTVMVAGWMIVRFA